MFLLACQKEETKSPYSITYKLSGKFFRDSTLTNDGVKVLDLRKDGNYCWTRQISGKDSIFCYGKFVQTSDTSLVWEDNVAVYFTINRIDSIPKGIILQLNASPAVPALYGFYE
ncbi:MAG: hypothetical protein MH472_14485 [Bacteroidia bacterium]|nr:hypothetical protein [Bacteroidia bacterium]